MEDERIVPRTWVGELGPSRVASSPALDLFCPAFHRFPTWRPVNLLNCEIAYIYWMSSSKSLDTWLLPTVDGQRKRKDVDHEAGDTSDKENSMTSQKKQKRTRTAPTSRAKGLKSKAKQTDTLGGGNSKKAYNDSIKAIDKEVASLDKQIKSMSGGLRYPSITTDDYAMVMSKRLPAVTKLAELDSKLAFNLSMSMADATHTDLDSHPKMCGFGDGDKAFKSLDESLLLRTEACAKPWTHSDSLPSVRNRWTPEDAGIGIIKSSYGPNKQQRNAMQRQSFEWEKQRRVERRNRRESTEDWVACALNDLKEDRDFLDQYGVDGYFPRSIARLQAWQY